MKINDAWAFPVFRYTLAIVIFIQSVMTVVHAAHSPVEGHIGKILPWFAGVEAGAAVLLLIPKTIKIGGWILLVIFAVAVVVHGPIQGLPLFVYAAGVLLVMFHSPVASNALNTSNEVDV